MAGSTLTAWNKHVKDTYDKMKKKNPKATLKEALKAASATYKK